MYPDISIHCKHSGPLKGNLLHCKVNTLSANPAKNRVWEVGQDLYKLGKSSYHSPCSSLIIVHVLHSLRISKDPQGLMWSLASAKVILIKSSHKDFLISQPRTRHSYLHFYHFCSKKISIVHLPPQRGQIWIFWTDPFSRLLWFLQPEYISSSK